VLKRGGVRGPYRWLSPGEKTAILLGFREGARVGQVVAEFGISRRHASLLRDAAVMSRRRVAHSPHRLSFEERERILIGITRGESDAEIARAIGRHRSTVGREIARCGRRHHYRALKGEQAQKACRRPKSTKLASDPRLLCEVERRLLERCSPEQISARLRLEFPDDPRMRISHETIYVSLYVQARGELRRELAKCLRTGRTHRKPQGRSDRRGTIPDMVMISERPAEVEDRAVPGHWEGDLLMGKAWKSQVATLVERSTRFVMLAALDDKTAAHIAGALAKRIQTLPGELRRSLTWDQGTELAEHKAFSISSGVPVYFCDPHSPWQRGSNENTTACCASTCPKAPTSPVAPSTSSTRSPTNSTAAPGKRSRGSRPPRSCANSSTRFRTLPAQAAPTRAWPPPAATGLSDERYRPITHKHDNHNLKLQRSRCCADRLRPPCLPARDGPP
jgi:transposase, IS30 family